MLPDLTKDVVDLHLVSLEVECLTVLVGDMDRRGF